MVFAGSVSQTYVQTKSDLCFSLRLSLPAIDRWQKKRGFTASWLCHPDYKRISSHHFHTVRHWWEDSHSKLIFYAKWCLVSPDKEEEWGKLHGPRPLLHVLLLWQWDIQAWFWILAALLWFSCRINSTHCDLRSSEGRTSVQHPETWTVVHSTSFPSHRANLWKVLGHSNYKMLV